MGDLVPSADREGGTWPGELSWDSAPHKPADPAAATAIPSPGWLPLNDGWSLLLRGAT